MRYWGKKNPLFIMEKKIGSGFTGPRAKTMEKWTPVLIHGRFFINDYSQGKIIFESHTRMVCNEFLEKDLRIPLFPGQRRKKCVASGFGLKVMFGGSIFVSGHCTLQLSGETIPMIDTSHFH